MPEYLTPGVYVEEVEAGPKPIEGVGTSTAGFLGKTERGPTEPRLVTSFADFKRVFGGVVDGSNLAYAVDGFFRNGGGRCYVGRVTGSTTTADAAMVADAAPPVPPEDTTEHLGASASVLDFGEVSPSVATPPTKTVTVENLDADGNDVAIADADIAIDGPDKDEFAFSTATAGDVTLSPGDTEDIEVTFTPTDDSAKEATLTIGHDGTNSPVTVALRAGTGVLGVEAVGPGSWGSHVVVLVNDATMYEPGENQLFKVTIRYWADDADLAAAKTHHADTEHDAVPDPDAEEVYDNLSPDPSSSDYYVTRLNSASNLVTVERRADGRPASSNGSPTWLGGNFTTPPPDVSLSDYEGDATVAPDERTGLAAFQQIDEISIVCVPDEHTHANIPEHGLTNAVKDHCENMKDRFAILQSKQNAARPGQLTRPVDSSYAAFYYPWLEVLDPETSNETLVPPGGHVAGIYARTDTERGVHKAPANEVVRGVQALQVNITKQDQASLNPKGVNCIRSFRGRGIRVWGARTTSSDALWKYVNVRRLFLFLEESIDEGTQWVVFEGNNERTWARVRQSVRNFLTGVWEDGALMGSTPEEAFYVKCDRSTMTQDDIDNGRLICEIGVAPTKPAEFVVFRIAQWTGGAEGS